MIKKLNKEGEDPTVMSNKIEVKYWDQAEILDHDTIVMHLFLVCAKLYKFKLIQAQVEAEVNDMKITYKSLIGHMNVA